MIEPPVLICDLFTWLPPWGEFDVRDYDDDGVRSFVVEVDYEVGHALEADKPIKTKLIRFHHPVAVLRCHWPLPQALFLGPVGVADRGQIYDLGGTELRANCMFNFRRTSPGVVMPELRHYYVYFDDMGVTFQVVAESVEVSDTDPPSDV